MQQLSRRTVRSAAWVGKLSCEDFLLQDAVHMSCSSVINASPKVGAHTEQEDASSTVTSVRSCDYARPCQSAMLNMQLKLKAWTSLRRDSDLAPPHTDARAGRYSSQATLRCRTYIPTSTFTTTTPDPQDPQATFLLALLQLHISCATPDNAQTAANHARATPCLTTTISCKTLARRSM